MHATVSTLRAALVAAALSAAGAANAVALEPFVDTSRVVSIGGSLTEIIYALGEEDRLVARDQTAVYPPEVQELPDVGYMRALAPEGVLSVSPTALLVIEGSGPPEALDVLSQAGVDYRTVPESYSHEGILAKVRAVGEALDVEDKAETLIVQLDAALTAAEERTARIAEPKRVLFILSMQGGKINASGTGTAANGILELAGAVNAIEDYAGYKALTEEAIIEAAPDVILMMDRGGDHDATADELFAHPAIALTPAGKNHAVIKMDGAYLLGFGPRTAEAVTDLAEALYPDL
ncbi:heme/hemin ABC transporter substrate-binding protein [Devosia nitrariae]|uniref:Hemin ABC transporter substrate-binding protein n=1 Tax=Devosia nitrariae TaxID=2071872 RepID=A0ABQ5W3K7_9HYPH|nr:hemin ABC transporter substrate-binding protein [Devosia nitrariae]GLQ54650.1 hemin ABC transporter substrate-binding protein [Devosia nitrariae]